MEINGSFIKIEFVDTFNIINEAVLDTYKASYTNPFDKDRIKILKARKSTDFHKKDTLVLKFMGEPSSIFQLDFVKTPAELLEREILQ